MLNYLDYAIIILYLCVVLVVGLLSGKGMKSLQNRKKIKGLKMVYEPQYLRFFQARFERLK